MQAAYEAGLAGAKVYRLKKTRNGLRQHHPDLDLRGLAPEVLFKNRSPADIDALDEATFQATIDEWKRANGIEVVSNAERGTKVYRLKLVRGQLQHHHPDLDLSKFTPEGLFPNKSSADINALDEAAFLDPINGWKRANNIPAPKPKGSKKLKATIAALNVDVDVDARAAAPAAPLAAAPVVAAKLTHAPFPCPKLVHVE